MSVGPAGRGPTSPIPGAGRSPRVRRAFETDPSDPPGPLLGVRAGGVGGPLRAAPLRRDRVPPLLRAGHAGRSPRGPAAQLSRPPRPALGGPPRGPDRGTPREPADMADLG